MHYCYSHPRRVGWRCWSASKWPESLTLAALAQVCGKRQWLACLLIAFISADQDKEDAW